MVRKVSSTIGLAPFLCLLLCLKLTDFVMIDAFAGFENSRCLSMWTHGEDIRRSHWNKVRLYDNGNHHGRTTTTVVSLSLLQSKIDSDGDDNDNNDDNDNDKDDDGELLVVKVGSGEYYEGFLKRSLTEEPSDRVTGDAILGPTIKFVGGASVILLALLIAFLSSNDLLP